VIGRSDVELVQALDLSQQVAATVPATITFAQLGIASRTEFGRAQLKGGAYAYGVHIGVFGQLNPQWSVGARYLSPLEFFYEGAVAKFTQTTTGLVLPPGNPICFPTGANPICAGNPNATVDVDALVAPQFATGGKLVEQGVQTRITHPAQVEAGVGYSGFKDWLVSFDYSWVGWRRFKTLPIDFTGPANGSNRVLFEDYNNTSAFRFGAQRQFTSGAQLRLGFSGVASAAPDETVTPLLPEQDRAYATIGGEYPFMNRYAIQAAYLRVMAPGKRGRVVERTSRAQLATQLNTGKYELDANVFALSLKATF